MKGDRMSFNQMQDAYQKTLKQSQAYKLAAQKNAYSNQMKQAKQALGLEESDKDNALSKKPNSQAFSPQKADSSSTLLSSQNRASLQMDDADVVKKVSEQALGNLQENPKQQVKSGTIQESSNQNQKESITHGRQDDGVY